MTAATKRTSVDEYLELERRSPQKHEFFAGSIFAMAGGSPVHNLLALNAAGELREALRERACTVYPSDQRVRTLTSLFTYPDVSVVCGHPEFDDEQRDTLTNPVVLIEVLSPTTEAYDRGQKFLNVRSIPTLKEYMLISQRQMLVEHFERRPNGQWVLTTYSAADQLVVFPSLNISIPMASLYLKVDLPASPSLRDDGTELAAPSPS